jgi:hypothetical protein
MASIINFFKLTTTNTIPEPHNCESNSVSSRSASSVASGVSFSVVRKTRAKPNHEQWERGPLKEFITNYVVERKLEPLGTTWVGLYTAHPELIGLPRFSLPALQRNPRAILMEHMTLRPSAALLAKFYPVPVWEEPLHDHPACEETSPDVVQALSVALYEDYLVACAGWETNARMAIRKQTVDAIVTASQEIPDDTSVLSQFRLVPRSVRCRIPESRVTKEGASHESESCSARVEKWLHGIFGTHGFEIEAS